VACAPAAPKVLERCGSTVLAGDVQSKCYELGRAEFRGVLWPPSKGGSFSLSVVTSNKEYDFDVAAPAFDWGLNVKEVRPLSSALTFGVSDRIIGATGLGQYGSTCSSAYHAGEYATYALAAG
jgi:hypothetical protein